MSRSEGLNRMDFELINIGIAELKVSHAPNVLRTILGSCVGICLYDGDNKIGGMSHIMLPVHKDGNKSPLKYADSAIPLLVKELEKLGADSKILVAKIIGGAMMFNLGENSLMGEIGRNNIKKAKLVLEELGISIISEDTAGNYGRTVDFFLDTGEVEVRSMGREKKRI